ncbi:MAG TPA: alpha/beta hydrolase [Planctomycetes bacterium]|nr:alpha/beta hydrolase [Planctomycetota bacterium]
MLHRLVVFAVCSAAIAQGADEVDFDVVEEIVYSKIGDRDLLLDAFVPKADGTHPAVLVVHGGAWRQGNRKQLRGYATSLTKMGFVCFAIDYRLAPDHTFPAQIEDCRAAVKWIRTHAAQYKVDSQKLGAIGYSAGGHLVSLLATTGEAPSEKNGNIDTRIQAVAAGGAPTDFRWFPDKGKWAEYWMGGDLEAVPEKFLAASTAAFVDSNDAPIFFFNGTADKLVPLIWTMPCHTALKAAGVTTEMHIIEGAGHLQAAVNTEALQKAYAFLKRELKGDDAQPQPASAAKDQ